jgi:hypothetical protein
VTAALAAAGVTVSADDAADVHAVVTAEALKPEDRSVLASVHGPAVMILNKADLAGFTDRGPLAVAHRRSADWRALTGVPTVPMVGLLAIADVDDELAGALRVLVDAPAELTSTDAFVQCAHVLTREVRTRLLERLDRFGIAHGVLAIGDGADPASLTALMRRLSLVNGVVAQLDAAAAPVRYLRLQSAIDELRVLAAQSDDDRITEFLSTDDTVLAVMTAAVDVVEAAGARVDRTDNAQAHRRRAIYWRRYGRGPVGDLHRRCAADIRRGSLRLLGHPS